MTDFENYLQQNGYREDTIKGKRWQLNQYLKWLKENHLQAEHVAYRNLMDFIGSLQQRNYGKYHINQHLNTVEHYYNFLQLPNPAPGERLRNPRKPLKPMFTAEELNAIYEHYDLNNRTGKYRHTDKPMLSLIIYQALNTADLFALDVKDVNLTEGKLHVPGKWNRKSRKIPLESHQILSLHDYIARYRGRHDSTRLFIAKDQQAIEDAAKFLNRYLKAQIKRKLNLDIRNLQHLRQSRLAIWVTQHGLRQAQYFAGFRSVEGIEKYKTQHQEDLRKSIDECHPLK